MKEITYIQFDQARLTVQTIHPNGTRERPSLIFLHHALGSIAQWGDFPEALSLRTGLSAVVFERLGHGSSDVPPNPRGMEFFHEEALESLPRLLSELGIEKPLLIGHSDGATIALLYAAHFPTSGVIAEAPHVMVESQTLEGICQALTKKQDLIKRLEKYHGGKTKELVECWAGTWLAPWFREWSIEDELPNISCPILILQGSADPYGTMMQARSIQLAAGGTVSCFEVPNGGHFLHVQARDAVLEEMSAFIRQIVTNQIS
ncbi:MAG: alpha/beta hydrolase [Lewinellaceae bacterium]|nr:alpha/beta hydrolase [Lewinellaceae bacterium]